MMRVFVLQGIVRRPATRKSRLTVETEFQPLSHANNAFTRNSAVELMAETKLTALVVPVGSSKLVYAQSEVEVVPRAKLGQGSGIEARAVRLAACLRYPS